VLCLSVSSTGAIAAGTADGQLWIGLGGDKRISVKKTRKWGGLREDMSLSRKIADGPVVALCVHSFSSPVVSNAFMWRVPRAFLNPVTIVTSTLLGAISQHSLHIESKTEDRKFESVLVAQTRSIAKVNGLAAYGDSVAVGGLAADGKGVAEVYQYKVV
jgi:hypothetical protein